MTEYDGHTIDVGPVTVGEPLARTEPSAVRLSVTDGRLHVAGDFDENDPGWTPHYHELVVWSRFDEKPLSDQVQAAVRDLVAERPSGWTAEYLGHNNFRMRRNVGDDLVLLAADNCWCAYRPSDGGPSVKVGAAHRRLVSEHMRLADEWAAGRREGEG